MALWCKHQNLLRDTVVFWSCGEQLSEDATAAGQGWSSQQLVVLDASLVNDQATQVGAAGGDGGWVMVRS